MSVVRRLCVGRTETVTTGPVDASADTVEAQLPAPGRARRGKTHGFGYPQRSPLIPTAGSKSCCCPESSAQRFGSRRAEMVPPNPRLRAGARRLVRRALGSADHATRRAGPAFDTFASTKAPTRSIPSLTTLTRSPEWRHGHSRNGRPTSTSATNVDVVYLRGWNSQIAPTPKTTLPRGSSRRRC